jgi:hypothetical protein
MSALIEKLIRCAETDASIVWTNAPSFHNVVRHECRKARPLTYRSADPTRSLIVNRRAIEARWRSIIHIPPSFRVGIVGRSSRHPCGYPVPLQRWKNFGPYVLSTLPVGLCQQAANRLPARHGGIGTDRSVRADVQSRSGLGEDSSLNNL